MTSGVFAISRGIFDHPFFADEALTEREAWIWLIREAAWRDRTTRAGKAVVKLERGECAHSIRFMAEAWGWHRSKVERFLERLKNETMIETRIETGVTVVTISNYDEYQKVSLPSKTLEETPSESEPRQQRDKQESIKSIKSTEDDNARAPDLKALIEQLWEAGGTALDRNSFSLEIASKPLAWIAGGADLALDILPTIKRISSRAKPGTIRDWEYFRRAIIEARDGRLAGLPAFVPVVVTPSDPTVWITEDDPRFRPLADRHERETGRKARAAGSRNETGVGRYFPKSWLDEAA